jgi:hypothetical protein
MAHRWPEPPHYLLNDIRPEAFIECYARACYLFQRDIGQAPQQIAAHIQAIFPNIVPAGLNRQVQRRIEKVYRACEKEVLTRIADLILVWMNTKKLGILWTACGRNRNVGLRNQPVILKNTPPVGLWFQDDPQQLGGVPTLDQVANIDLHQWMTRPAAVAEVWRDCVHVYATWRIMDWAEPIMLALEEVQRELVQPVFTDLRNRQHFQELRKENIHRRLQGTIGALDHMTWPPPVHGNQARPNNPGYPLPRVAWNWTAEGAILPGPRRSKGGWLREMDDERRTNSAALNNNPPP